MALPLDDAANAVTQALSLLGGGPSVGERRERPDREALGLGVSANVGEQLETQPPGPEGLPQTARDRR